MNRSCIREDCLSSDPKFYGNRKVCRSCRIKDQSGKQKVTRQRWRLANPEKNKARIRTIKSRYSSGKSSAKTRNHIWDLTLEQYTDLIKSPCEYCSGKLSESGWGLDRKDNSIGYTLNNCVACCTDCNYIKGTRLSYAEMIEVARLLKRMRDV